LEVIVTAGKGKGVKGGGRGGTIEVSPSEGWEISRRRRRLMELDCPEWGEGSKSVAWDERNCLKREGRILDAAGAKCPLRT